MMCCRDSSVVVLVTRGDEDTALLGWCCTLALLFARGMKGERVFVRVRLQSEVRRHPGRGLAW